MNTSSRSRFPLWAQTLAALLLGLIVGVVFGGSPIVGSFDVNDLGRVGMLVIRALKTLAVPLVALVILDALLRFEVEGRQGWKLVRICLTNVAVALAIGLLLVNVLTPGRFLVDLFAPVLETGVAAPVAAPALDPVGGLESMVPRSIGAPFVGNEVLGAALLALLLGAALRSVRRQADPDTASTFRTVSGVVHLVSETFQRALSWTVRFVPLAAFALVAQAVGRAGLSALSGLWAFLAVIFLGMALHAGVYYTLIAWLRGGVRPAAFLGAARDPLVTGIATNSSLATIPVTLRGLERIGVSERSARLGACLGTNLNNDGITLYEAMAVLIIAQACGLELGLVQQLAVVGAALMAGAGIAGIPEAGLVMLPMVLAAAGLPDVVVAAAVPLVVPVDWILARTRSAVNVMSDMVVSILLDREEPVSGPAAVPMSVPVVAVEPTEG